MKNRFAALFMAAVLVLYLVLVGQRAVMLMYTGVPVAIVMGVVLLVLPLVAAWAVGHELLFGLNTQKLVRILQAEGGLPVDTLPHRASGRPMRDAADAEFPRYKAEVESAPDSWRAWFRLGLAYDASGDRRRARRALREAISLYRVERRAAA